MKLNISLPPISREETNFLKGVAILLIILHNYYRWVIPITGENEFAFSASAITRSLIFIRTNPLEFFHVFLNFLGHYGVQGFIFISAYGLTLSYRTSHPSYGRFILHRFDKLYPAFVMAALIYILFTLIREGELIGPNLLKDLGIQLTLFGNLFPGKAMAISGPWWFYSFIFEFYLVFPLFFWMYRKTGWMGLAGLVILGYLFTYLMYGPMTKVHLNPYMTFLGHMPELCLGIFLAGREKARLPLWVFLLALILFAGGNTYSWLWPFANLGATIVLIVAIQALMRIRHRMKNLYSLLSFIGILSMYLFACHGFMRAPFIGLANELDSPVSSLLIAILFVTVVIGVSWLMMQTEQSARRWISEPGKRFPEAGRFLLMTLLVAGSFIVLFVKENTGKLRGIAGRGETILFTARHSFDEPIPGRWDHLTDSITYNGTRTLLLNPPESFSPGFIIDLDSMNLHGRTELEVSAMVYGTETEGTIDLVMELNGLDPGTQLEWKSERLSAGRFIPGTWTPLTYRYSIPSLYRQGRFQLRIYLWNHGKGAFYADELILTLKHRR